MARKIRNANVELLRIITMLFIIMHHCVINGYGLQEQLKSGILNGCLVYNKNTQNCRGDSPKLQREIPQ